MLLKNVQFRCSAFLFDMDGTLLNSEIPTFRAYRTWADKYGLDIETVLRTGQGRRTEDTLRELAPTGVDVSDDILEVMAREREDVDGVREIAGASAFLRALPVNRWAIVTSADRHLARARIAAAGLPPPPAIITAEDVKDGKPSPEGYLLAARRLGVDAADCMVFEDAPAGLTAGESAGARVVAVASKLMAGRLGKYNWIENYLGIRVAADGGEIVLSIA